MLVNSNQLLKDAYENKYALGAFNCYNLETIQGTIEAAEEANAPVMVAFGEKYLTNMDLDTVYAIVHSLAKKATVPVVLHLDHSSNIDTIIRAIKAGFTSVMYDGSMLSFEENMENTKRVVEIAHAADVSVEAELGSLAAGEKSHEGSADDEEALTDPKAAQIFVQESGVDSLAVSVGTVHGLYDGEPNIRLELLKEINGLLQIPLVLHGGSGIPEKDIIACINNGITKMNVNTELSNHTVDQTLRVLERDHPHLSVLALKQKDAIKEIVTKYINFLSN